MGPLKTWGELRFSALGVANVWLFDAKGGKGRELRSFLG